MIPTTAQAKGPDRPAIRKITLGDMLAETAVAAPDRVAVIESTSGRSWTYAQLHDSAQRAAGFLGGRYERGEHVAIWANNIPEWIVAEFGCAMAGLVIVTVNPAFTRDEALYVLEQSGAAGVLAVRDYRGSDLVDIAGALRAECASLRDVTDLSELLNLADSETAVTPRRCDADDPIMVQYTSGTTGHPKGAVLSHRGLVNNGHHTLARMGVAEGDVILTIMPLFHTAGSVLCVLGATAARATQILVPAFEPGPVLDAIEKHGVTVLLAVPTMLNALIEHPSFPTRDLSTVRIVGSGGSPVPPALVQHIEDTLDVRFVIVMGQTEASPVSAMTTPDDAPIDRVATIGTAMPGVEIKIIDTTTGETVRPGTPGEYCTRGYHVMKGYFDMPDATAATIDPEGWLRSGDLCSMDDRGYCRVEGRLKDMIIRGGENLYPLEIEDRIIEHPSVAEAAVIGLPDDHWGEVVAAFVRPAPLTTPRQSELLAWLRAVFAPYKTPQHWFTVDAFPLTASGKIQKFKLLDSWRNGEAVPLEG